MLLTCFGIKVAQFFISLPWNVDRKKDGKKLVDDERVRLHAINASHGSYELAIDKIVAEDAGVYECIAKNKFGQESFEARVKVVGNGI